MKKLILVRSFPGSGKSSFVRSEFPNIFHLENDFFHYHGGEYAFSPRKQEEAIRWCMDSALLAMSRGMDICISNTFTKRRYLDSYVNMARAFGYEVEIYRMMGDFGNVHGVTEEMKDNFRSAMEDYEGETYVYPKEGFEGCEKKGYDFRKNIGSIEKTAV